VRDLTIDLANNTGSAIAVLLCDHWGVINCNMLNIADSGYGVVVNGGSYWRIAQNYFLEQTPTGGFQNEAVLVSISQGDAGYAEIADNICVNTGMDVSLHDSVISRNRVTGVKYGAGIATNADSSTQRDLIMNNICLSGRGRDVNSTWIEGFEVHGLNHIVQGNVGYDNDGDGFSIWAKRSIVMGNVAKG
jgi:hypothetical protein